MRHTRLGYVLEALLYLSVIGAFVSVAWLGYATNRRMQREHEFFMTHTEETLRAHDAFLQEHQRHRESH